MPRTLMPPVRPLPVRPLLLLVLAAAAILALPRPALAWWNDAWTLRKPIHIDLSATGAGITEPVGRFPLLIRLHDGVFAFAHAADDGRDLRVVAGDDETPLKFHIERFDPLLGQAFLWVDIPDLKPGEKTTIWLYYGNKDAPPAADAKAVFDAETKLVYHFSDGGDGSRPPVDATAFGHNASTPGRIAAGALIGDGLRLDGQTRVVVPAAAPLAVGERGPLTLSTWVKLEQEQPNAVLYARGEPGRGVVVGVDGGVPFVEVSDAGGVGRSTGGAALTPGSWQHLAVVAAGEVVTVFVDGRVNTRLERPLPALTTAATLGGEALAAPAAVAAPGGPTTLAAPSAAVRPGLVGEIDEFRLAAVARPEAYLLASVAAEGARSGPPLVTVDAREETSSWLSGYLAILIGALTIDGWVVVIICLVMAVVSWIIMVQKTAFVRRQDAANRRFRRVFDAVADDLGGLRDTGGDGLIERHGAAPAGGMGQLRHSSLYHLYAIGTDGVRARLAGASGPEDRAAEARPATARVLEPHAIAALRARLDAQMVRETQRLNSQLVLLTIAISGGPFLGLLGTVVGVMITFAAVAAAGDVNVNAIAPGIAAALIATVAGLTVAIPALFGYNYLITRVKEITADMRVFVDEFITSVAESHRPMDTDDRPRLAAE